MLPPPSLRPSTFDASGVPPLPAAPMGAIDWRALRGPLLVALPGAGCSPAVFGGLHAPGWTVQPVDWAEPPHSPHSCDPREVARRLADALRPRVLEEGAGPVVLLGYSVGGVLALLTALQSGLRYQGVSYKSVTQILTDLMGGQLDFVFIDTLSAAPALQNDRLRPIAVTSPRSLPSLPQVPPASSVVPGLELQGWFGLAAPAGTPAVAVEGMGRALQQAMADPAVQQAYAARGFENQWRSGPDLQRFIQEDIRRWAQWVEMAGIERM